MPPNFVEKWPFDILGTIEPLLIWFMRGELNSFRVNLTWINRNIMMYTDRFISLNSISYSPNITITWFYFFKTNEELIGHHHLSQNSPSSHVHIFKQRVMFTSSKEMIKCQHKEKCSVEISRLQHICWIRKKIALQWRWSNCWPSGNIQ